MESFPKAARTTQVPVFEGASDTAAPGEQVALETRGLNGGTAVAVGCERSDGSTSIQLTHYPPFMIDRHLAAIARLAHPEDLRAERTHAVVHAHERRSEQVGKIVDHLRTLYGPGVTIGHSSYGATDPDTFAVVSGGDAGTPITRIP